MLRCLHCITFVVGYVLYLYLLLIASLCFLINQEFFEMAELQQWKDKLLHEINAGPLGLAY